MPASPGTMDGNRALLTAIRRLEPHGVGMTRGRGALTGAASPRGKPLATFAEGRICLDPSCDTRLSRYNEEQRCFLHAQPGADSRWRPSAARRTRD